MQESELTARRMRMVEEQIIRRGVRDSAVIEAMRRVRRHEFVSADLVESAYDDSPLPIGFGQTISQPYIVASMTAQLRLTEGAKVFEIGTGSGYQTAVLAALGYDVYTVELIPELAQRTGENLFRSLEGRVQCRVGDGREGWPEAATFDGIMVTAAAEEIPPILLNQLGVNGRMIIPVRLGMTDRQELVLASRTAAGVSYDVLYQVRFVPLRREPSSGPQLA